MDFALQPQPESGGFIFGLEFLDQTNPPVDLDRGLRVRSSRLYVVSASHDRAPLLKEGFDPDDIDTFWFAWDGIFPDASISLSEFLLPVGWTSIDTKTNEPVSDMNNVEYEKANGVTLSTTFQSGTHHIVNRVTFSSGERLDRGVYVRVSTTL